MSTATQTVELNGINVADNANQHVDGGRARRRSSSRAKKSGSNKASKKRSGSRRRSRSRSK